MSDASPFSHLVPGFDFLQGLVKNANAAMPAIGQWVAPTLDPDELGKRIEELRTVQFWLEQNARMIGATIQALEVQRMTLTTLKTMNVQMEDLRESMKIRLPVLHDPGRDDPPAPPPARSPLSSTLSSRLSSFETESSAEKESDDEGDEPTAASGETSGGAAAGAVDPMQWWGALTKQFTELATNAMKDVAASAAAAAQAAQVAKPAPTAKAKPGAGTTSASTDASASPPASGATKPRRSSSTTSSRSSSSAKGRGKGTSGGSGRG